MHADAPAPSALDALLRVIQDADKHANNNADDDAAFKGAMICSAYAPRLAAIVRVLVGPAADVLAAYDALVNGKSIPSYGAVDRLRTALARAEAIARGEES